ncbi:MAG: hypothetical protein RL385_3816 [Pseudomonadota bacterium]
MLQARLFLPQSAIEHWLSTGDASLTDTQLELHGVAYGITPAVHVLQELAGGEDKTPLVGRVKTVEELTAMGGEVCAGSVVLGDCAFEVVEGFEAQVLTAPPGTTQDDLVKALGRR